MLQILNRLLVKGIVFIYIPTSVHIFSIKLGLLNLTLFLIYLRTTALWGAFKLELLTLV